MGNYDSKLKLSYVWLQLTGTVPAFLSTINTMTELELETNKVGQCRHAQTVAVFDMSSSCLHTR